VPVVIVVLEVVVLGDALSLLDGLVDVVVVVVVSADGGVAPVVGAAESGDVPGIFGTPAPLVPAAGTAVVAVCATVTSGTAMIASAKSPIRIIRSFLGRTLRARDVHNASWPDRLLAPASLTLASPGLHRSCHLSEFSSCHAS